MSARDAMTVLKLQHGGRGAVEERRGVDGRAPGVTHYRTWSLVVLEALRRRMQGGMRGAGCNHREGIDNKVEGLMLHR
jgi:hypothetical protein